MGLKRRQEREELIWWKDMFQQNVEELATLQISQSPHEVLEQQLP